MNYTPLDDSFTHGHKKMSKKSLWMILFGVFILGLQVFKLSPTVFFISPLPSSNNTLAEVTKKLSTTKNTYKLQVHNHSSIIPQVAAATEDIEANSYAVIDYDSGEVIEENNLSKKVPIASLTKIMTAVVALDLATPDELLAVSQDAAEVIPTKIAVRVGERMSLWELLHASLMTSANDATQVIKDGVDAKYGEPVFIQAMNEKAQFIGLKNSHFANPQGFDDDNHYSSAEDLAILTHYALTNYPLIAEITKKDEVYLPENQYHQAQRLVNWNGLLDVYPNIFGVKIGNTGWAATTTIVGAERDGKKVLVVLLGAPNVLKRDMQAAELLDYGFKKLTNSDPVNVTEDDLRAKYATWN